MPYHQSVHVLYMEDDKGAARLFQRKLEPLGYVVDLAYDGESGLAMYREDQHDVVAVDQTMPGYGGLDVIRMLAGNGALPPIIMITGNGDERVAVEAMKLGAGDYIVKDTDGGYLELVPSVIEQLLQKHRLVYERQRALEALERSNTNLALLNQLSQALTALLNADQIIQELLWAATDIAGAQASSLWLWSDQARTRLVCRGIFRRGEFQGESDCTLALKNGLVGQVAMTGKSAIADVPFNSNRYPDAQAYPMDIASLLAVPLVARDAVIGVLEAANKVNEGFDGYDSLLLETLAASGAIALDNARLVETLRQQAEELGLQNEDLDAFSHTVAHDLKNPVSLILGYSGLMLDNCASKLDEQDMLYMNRVMNAAQKMTNIIDELLMLAEIRKVEIEPKPLDMTTTAFEARIRLMNLFEETQAEIICPDVWPVALGHAPWIEEVWVNYLSNAMKYGGEPPRIEMGATPLENGYARFWVKDNGPGLTAEERARLFAPFTRLQQVRSKGHGLGLSIVRRIVEKLGGEVGVESEIGQGSTFSFTLPLARDESK